MQLTPEQQAVINTNYNLVINAVAGSGKTIRLIEYAKSREPGKKMLYLAFNKTVKRQPYKKFTPAGVDNVKVETAHSLAFNHIIKHSNYQLIQVYKNYEWCDILDIKNGWQKKLIFCMWPSPGQKVHRLFLRK